MSPKSLGVVNIKGIRPPCYFIKILSLLYRPTIDIVYNMLRSMLSLILLLSTPIFHACVKTRPVFYFIYFPYSGLQARPLWPSEDRRLMSRRQPHCLQRYRKRNALTQAEIAFLLGCNTPAQVSQYERLRRQPSGETMLRCQAIFGEPVDKLFPVLSEQVEEETKKRARELRDRIGQGDTNASAKRKLEFLNDIMDRRGDEPATLPWEKKTLVAS